MTSVVVFDSIAGPPSGVVAARLHRVKDHTQLPDKYGEVLYTADVLSHLIDDGYVIVGQSGGPVQGGGVLVTFTLIREEVDDGTLGLVVE